MIILPVENNNSVNPKAKRSTPAASIKLICADDASYKRDDNVLSSHTSLHPETPNLNPNP